MSDSTEAFDARRTYDAASRDYDDASRDYWQFLSERAVDLARLQPGERVLDAQCGTGPATIAAAGRVEHDVRSGALGTHLSIAHRRA